MVAYLVLAVMFVVVIVGIVLASRNRKFFRREILNALWDQEWSYTLDPEVVPDCHIFSCPRYLVILEPSQDQEGGNDLVVLSRLNPKTGLSMGSRDILFFRNGDAIDGDPIANRILWRVRQMWSHTM